MSHIIDALKDSHNVLETVLSNQDFLQGIDDATNTFINTFNNGGSVFSCGNGGSLCDSMHFAEELTGRFRKDRAPLPATSIMDPSHFSCVANDFGYEHIFSRYLEAWAKPGDTLLAITTSGNSPNVIEACKVAKKKNVNIIALLGKTGGEVKDFADVSLIVPSNISDRIQEIHIKCIHIFIEGIERKLFPENY